MNVNDNDDRLDELLRQWADESTEPDRLSNLNDRITSSLTESVEATEFVRAANGQESPSVTRCVWADSSVNQSRRASAVAVGTVLTALLATGFVLLYSERPEAETLTDGPPAYAWLQTEQLQDKTVLLNEMEDLFDEQLVWLAETSDQMDFGLDESSDVSDSSPGRNERVAVRVVVQHRRPGSSDWQLAWMMDVVSRDEELITIAPKQADGNGLQLWTYRLPDGAIAVDGEVQLAGKNPFRAETSGLHHNGTPMKVATAQGSDGDYRVFQSVAVLDGRVI